MRMRVRNLRHLFRYEGDIDHLAPVRDRFIDTYCAATGQQAFCERHVRHHFEAYFTADPATAQREAPSQPPSDFPEQCRTERPSRQK